ncbi:SAM-dependent methyltransferase [Haloarculaceae archaeon H-GB2-1]|nr:SAM-dependent methyltransferase [Haloarculaceae archaeon H-GB1-1]MEA5386157.1 SAM-dependent methyltransferase [Haloarculaceae archaeon H-GB11]MEA5407663.1 SAM-dependent methyltransferase [Haloarculaceae archaeon H-GB2-1]
MSDAQTATDAEIPDDYGTLYVVGIGPGLPDQMTKEAKRVIEQSDCIIASNLYQEFLREDDTLPPKDAAVEGESDDSELADEEGTVLEREDGTRQTLIRSSMGKQIELAKEAFERVKAGEDVAHVSGGDPNVYGKSDLLFTMARAEEATEVPIEIVPGLTAALGGAANVGAPLSNDFCTISLSDKWRGWDEIEEKLRAAAISDFIIVLYNCWRNYEKAIEIIREERADDCQVAIFNDAGRAEQGRNLDDETHTFCELGEATEHDDEVGGMGTSLIIGNHETEVWENDYREFLVTPRGGRDVDDF